MLPPEYRRSLLLNVYLLVVSLLFFGLTYALDEAERSINEGQFTAFMLLLLVFLVGMLLNGGLAIRALLRKHSELAVQHLVAAGLWFLLFRWLITGIGHLGDKIGG